MIRPIIRMAQDDEGEDIRYILDDQIPDGWDWSHVYPHWLLAVHNGIIIGVIQVLVGKPLGHIGFLAVLPGYENQGVGVYLAEAAQSVLSNSGACGVTFTSVNPVVIRTTKKYGAFVYGDPVKLLFKPVPQKGKNQWVVHQSRQSRPLRQRQKPKTQPSDAA